jgi:RloB-like protein
MKNKKAAQIEAKLKHLESINAAKGRRREKPTLERGRPTKKEKPTILIVCEGSNTEPSYFEQFKLSLASIKTVGKGFNTVSLVKQAIALSKKGKYEKVWCVFDADPKPDNQKQTQNFNNAVKMATANGFEDHQGGAMNRDDYDKKINSCINKLGAKYDGTDAKIVTEDFFDLLMSIDEKTKTERMDLAIARAERNYNKWSHQNPAKEESTTRVFELVKELKTYL